MTKFSVVTYNIHSCLGIDGQWLPDRVNRAIRDFDAEIIGLQEVGWHLRGRPNFNQYAYLKQHSGFEVAEGPVKHREDAHFGNALLTREPADETRAIDLTIQSHVPRGAIDIDVTVDGHLIRVVNMHLGLAPWERRIQIGRVIVSLAERRDVPTLLMGDFNHWRPGSDSLTRLTDILPHMATAATWHTRLPVVPFDRILASRHFRLLGNEVVVTPETQVASDHLPLKAWFALD